MKRNYHLIIHVFITALTVHELNCFSAFSQFQLIRRNHLNNRSIQNFQGLFVRVRENYKHVNGSQVSDRHDNSFFFISFKCLTEKAAVNCTSVYAEGCQQVCQMGDLIWRQQHVDTAHLPIQLQLMSREEDKKRGINAGEWLSLISTECK